MSKYRVIIVDDEPIIRDSLRQWLSFEYDVLCFASGEDLLNAFNHFNLKDGKPTCILLDLQMEGMNGIELQASLKTLNVEFPIIFISGNAQQADIITAWRHGAVDFVLKPFTTAQINEALEKQFDILKQHQLQVQVPDKSESDDPIPLTKREAQVLMLLGQGYQQIEVSQKLCVSVRTVKMYRAILKHKFNLNTLMELARYYDQHRIAITKIVEKT